MKNWGLLGRAVRYLVAAAGIWQYLDIGSGLPTASNVHVRRRSCLPLLLMLHESFTPAS